MLAQPVVEAVVGDEQGHAVTSRGKVFRPDFYGRRVGLDDVDWIAKAAGEGEDLANRSV